MVMFKSTNRKTKYSDKGFSLIELFLAIFILTIGFAGVIAVFPVGARIGKSSERTTVAVELSQAKMEEITSKSYNEILAGIIEPETELASPFNGYFRETEVRYYDPLNLTFPGSDMGVKEIRVTVSWRSNLGISNSKVDLITLVARR